MLSDDEFLNAWLRNESQLRATIFMRTNSSEYIDDAMQDLFMRVWTKRSSLENDYVDRYLGKAAANMGADYKKQQWQRKAVYKVQERLDFSTPEDAFMAAEREAIYTKLRSVVSTLPAKYRKAAEAKYFSNSLMSEMEKGRRLGVPLSTYRWRADSIVRRFRLE
jgi:DNA-directed RNA polymerase specialized sigma24 family protein